MPRYEPFRAKIAAGLHLDLDGAQGVGAWAARPGPRESGAHAPRLAHAWLAAAPWLSTPPVWAGPARRAGLPSRSLAFSLATHTAGGPIDAFSRRAGLSCAVRVRSFVCLRGVSVSACVCVSGVGLG